MANPNIVNVSTIYGKTAVQAVTTTAADIVINAAASGSIVKINTLSIANINGTTAATITASIFRSSVENKLAHAISVPAGASLIVLDKTSQIYLEEGDSLRLTASTNAYLSAVCSYEIIS